MDNLCLFKNHQYERKYDVKELFELGHDVESLKRTVLPELMNKTRVRSFEKRAHKRSKFDKDVFALIRPTVAEQIDVEDRNMAEIACAVYRSKPIQFGRIHNISMGGLSFRYIVGEERSTQPVMLEILLADCGFYLCNLAFKSIVDVELADDFAINSFEMRQHQIQFDRLTPAQITKLKDFIQNYSRID